FKFPVVFRADDFFDNKTDHDFFLKKCLTLREQRRIVKTISNQSWCPELNQNKMGSFGKKHFSFTSCPIRPPSMAAGPSRPAACVVVVPTAPWRDTAASPSWFRSVGFSPAPPRTAGLPPPASLLPPSPPVSHTAPAHVQAPGFSDPGILKPALYVDHAMPLSPVFRCC